jgi:hypothetical protein
MIREPLCEFLADDHVRLARLSQQTKADPEKVDYGAYAEFRAGLLTHIALEEKILLPPARRLRRRSSTHRREVSPRSRRARRGVGASAYAGDSRKIQAILETHNLIEEGPGGVYEICEQLAGDQVEALVAEMRDARRQTRLSCQRPD